MRRSIQASLWVFGLILFTPGCNEIAGIPAVVPCETAADCAVAEPACRIASCEGGVCAYQDALLGTPLPEQTAGDCVQRVCDGAGSAAVEADPSDVADDDNPCTEDACVGDSPQHTPISAEVDCYTGPPGTEGKGLCKGGKQQCEGGSLVGACAGEVLPADEECDTDADESCDGDGYGGCPCVPAMGRSCYTGPEGTEDVGQCHGGTQICLPSGMEYGSCVGERTPAIEDCDDLEVDEDCDGQINEDGASCECVPGQVASCYDGDWAKVGVGICEAGSYVCPASGKALPCTLDQGDGAGEMASLPLLAFAPEPILVQAGMYFTCALLSDGQVKCWGDNASGQLGIGKTASPWNRVGDVPGEMPPASVDLGLTPGSGDPEKAVALAVGDYHACAIISSGRVRCWGSDSCEALGLGQTSDSPRDKIGDTPGEIGQYRVDLGTDRQATSIAAGYKHTCAILDNGEVKCWGCNGAGQLGLEDTNHRGNWAGEMGDALPSVKLGTARSALSLALGYDFTCALLDDRSVKCWGNNLAGQLGQGRAYEPLNTTTRYIGDQPGEMGDALPRVKLFSSDW